jgi:hypothetical protein
VRGENGRARLVLKGVKAGNLLTPLYFSATPNTKKINRTYCGTKEPHFLNKLKSIAICIFSHSTTILTNCSKSSHHYKLSLTVVGNIITRVNYLYPSLYPVQSSPVVLELGCLRHFVYSKFRIFRMFFFVSYTIRKWPNFREITRNFSMQIYTKFRGISRNSVTCYTNF